MDYERIKEQIIWDRIKQMYNDMDDAAKSQVERVFPELKESEDEKIRKAILELVKQSSEILEKKNQEQMIAWLEKQGEKKPNKCMYSKDNYTDEDRKVLCDGCEEDCELNKEEPVSDDLEKELSAYVNSKEYTNSIGTSGLLLIARHFANWQKEQMMAKAVDGDITFDYYGDGDKIYGCIAHDSFCLEDFGLKDRDKVKLILAKED